MGKGARGVRGRGFHGGDKSCKSFKQLFCFGNDSHSVGKIHRIPSRVGVTCNPDHVLFRSILSI